MDKMKQMMDEFWLYFQPNIFSMPCFLHTIFCPMQRVTLTSGQSARMRSQRNLWTLQHSYDHSSSFSLSAALFINSLQTADSDFPQSIIFISVVFFFFFQSRKSQISRRSLQLKIFMRTQTLDAKKSRDVSATSTNPTSLYIS